MTDLSDRKLLANDRNPGREKQELARLATEFVGVWFWDIPNDRITADESLAELFSVPAETAAAGAPLEQFLKAIHPDDRPEVARKLAGAIEAGSPYEAEYRIIQADGTHRWIIARGRCEYDGDGRPARLPGVAVDITERKLAEIALRESERRFRALADAMPQMVWATRPDGYHDYYNQRWYEFTGMMQGSTDGEAWNGMFHPDDQDRAWATWQNCLETGKPYEIEYRLRAADGSYRWVLGRALPVRDEDGRIERWFGTCTDIHDQKRSAEKLELLSHELSHRIKNVFAVISGLIGVLARKEPAAAGFADELRQRVDALGRAHELVRPHTEDSRPRVGEATVQGLLHELLSPYLGKGGSRLVVTGDDTAVDDRGATPLALIFHELATNAAKYGAWLNSEGRVGIDVTCRDGQCRLVWAETGGPPVDGPPEREGFGTGLARATVEHQLEGRVEKDWRREGLRVEITIPTVRLKGPDETP